MDKNATDHAQTTEAANMDSALLGHGSDWWSGAMIGSLGLAAFVAVLVVAATAGLVIVQKREAVSAKAELERYKSTADGKIAEAKTLGIKAGSDSAAARTESAQANARASDFENQAAQARLEAEKIKQAVAWRTIPEDVTRSLISELSAHKGSVNLRWTNGDPEAMFVAIEFSQILGKAGWKIGSGASTMRLLPFGIHIPNDDSADGKALRAAFEKVHIQFSAEPWPSNAFGLEFAVERIPNAPELYIGSRPPPALP